MKVLIATEARLDRTPDGACWNIGSASYEFWRRYLDVFDEVRVVARLQDVAEAPQGGMRVDGPRLTLAALPYYVGPWAYLRRYPALRHAARAATRNDHAVIVRAPGVVADLVLSCFADRSRPFGIEIVGDPQDSYGPGGVRTVLRPLLRQWWPRVLRRQCARASAAAYVTAHSLQRRYPAPRAMHVTSYSSIDLADNAFVGQPRPLRNTPGTKRVVFVGSLEQLYKAPDVLIDAVAVAVGKGADLELTLIGDGKDRPQLEARAANYGLTNRVRFVGHLASGDSVRKELDISDLFVLASRTEGLPRALIEAMARGLPCLGSHAGGIPELLSRSERVQAGDAHALADKLVEVLCDPERLARLSRENLEKALQYRAEALRPRRQAFYGAVREATIEWQRTRVTRAR